VLTEPTSARTWNLGRAYPRMAPEIALRLPQSELLPATLVRTGGVRR
jgi:hypothetical protein